MTDTLEVTYIHEQMRGAPVLSGTAGALIGLLDAFLLTGWGLVSASSVTVSGGIATATLPSGSAFEEGAVIQIAGATPAELNGRARVLPGASSTQVQWATTAADGAASGAITIKYAPQGSWEKAFSGTNKAAYRSTDVTGTRFFLRIDDTGTTTCRVRGYETMSDIDTGTGPFPTDAQISGGAYWHKSGAASAAAVPYVFAADNRAIRHAISPGGYSNASFTSSVVRGFGDERDLAPGGDGYCCTISASNTTSTSSGGYGAYSSQQNGSQGTYFARGFTGLGGSALARCFPYVGIETANSGADNTIGKFPSVVDGELKFSRRFLTLSISDYTPRADIAGLLHVPQSSVIDSISRLSKLAGAGELTGRTLLAVTNVTVSSYPSATPNGVDLLDITGPWR